MMHVRKQRGEAGFSLIEVLAALFVFTLLTLGLIPLLTSSIRGSNTARADTIGKNVALKAMERVRGLPYHISYATSTDRVDVLDLYYPNDDPGSPGLVTVGGVTLYRTTCPAAGTPECPVDIPDGYTIRFDAQFVDPVTTGAQPTPGETATSYANVPPRAGYQWDSPTNDRPERQILQMAITASWTVGGTNESYTITSLVSDRDFGERKTKATATMSYALDVYTAYDANAGGGTDLSAANAFIATSESDIEGRRLSTARQTSTAVRGEIQESAGGSLGTVVGATSNVLQAPPDQAPGNQTAASNQLRHPEFSNAPTLVYGPTAIVNPRVDASGLPFAIGDTEVTGVIPGQPEYVALKDPQLTVQDYNELILSSAGTGGPSLVSLVANNGLPAPLIASQDPPTTGDIVVGGSRAATSNTDTYAQATMGFDRLLMLKTTFIPDTAPWVDPVTGAAGTLTGTQGAIIIVDDFQAASWCRSEVDGGGDGDALYQATLYYWSDPAANGSRADGRYVRVTFNRSSSTTGADPLAAVMGQNVQAGQANGPLVYDHASANQRIYMFGKSLGRQLPGGGNARAAYLTSWNSLTTTSRRVEANTDASGAPVSSVNATIDGAIEIHSADFDVDRRDEGEMSLTIGSLSCFAEDAR